MMKWMKQNWAITTGVVSAVLVGFSHWLGHTLTGDPATFAAAGVMNAGLLAMLVAGLYTWWAVKQK